MRLQALTKDGGNRKNQPMEGLGRVVIGAAVGGLLGAAGHHQQQAYVSCAF